jgi:pyridoxine 5-phosphate synthase
MARLGVKIEHIAAIRERGILGDPDPVSAAVYAEMGGADGIVCTLHEEMKLLTERDIRLLKEIVKTHFTLQIPPFDKLIAFALSITPDMITLVPGKKPGTTQGGGLDVLGQGNVLARIIQDLRAQDIVVSLLIEPIIHKVKAAAKIGTDYVEFHMGQYSAAEDLNERADHLENTASVAMAARKIGLGVSASRGLNYQNVTDVAAIQYIEEINIGHAIISRAMWLGLETAVRDMAALVH